MPNKIKLTTTAVERLCDAGIYWDTQTHGLGVRVSDTGRKTYFYKRRVKGSGKERSISLGRQGDPVLHNGTVRSFPFGAEDARAKAAAVLAQLLAGVDPVAEQERKEAEAVALAQQDKAQSTTLRQMLEHYLVHRRTKHGALRQTTQSDIRKHIEGDLAKWLDLPMATTITRDACLVRFTELSKHAPSSANLTMIYLRALCGHARELHAKEDGEYTIMATNPITRMFKLRKPNPKKARTRRIPLNKVGAVWLMLRRRAAGARNVLEQAAADWVSVMLLTGMGKTESGSLQWADVDLDAKTFTLRGDVVKNHNAITLPMSSVLHEILSARKSVEVDEKVERRRRREVHADTYVFASGGRKTPYVRDARATMEAVSKIVGHQISPHDLRRSAEDCAKAVKTDSDERRQLLNHLASDVHGAHYSNNPDPEALRPAVEAIAVFITDAARVAEAQEAGTNIIAFPARA